MSEKADVFDRVMHLPILRKAEPFYYRHKEVLLYLFFGGLAFLVSIGTFWLFCTALGFHELVANMISWVITVLFAFFTNRIWVFAAPTGTGRAFWQQMASFYAGRAITLVIEELILLVFITWLSCPDLPTKVAAQIVVIVLNYVISKCLIFKKPS